MTTMNNDYKNNGFFINTRIFNDLFTDMIIVKMIYPIKKYCDYYNIYYNNTLIQTDLLYDMLENIYKLDKELYFNFVKQNGILSELYEIKSLFANEKIKNILDNMGFKNVSVPVSTQLNFYCDFATNKDYRDGKIGLDSHQDWPQTRGSLNNIVICVPLVDITEDTCPIEYVPKSHLKGFQNGEQNSHNIVPKYDQEDFKKIIMNKGDCLVFNGWLVHKTGEFKNNSKIRITVALRFNDIDDNYFISTQYYTSYKIIMDRSIKQSRIPENDEILKYYDDNNKIIHFGDLYNKRKFWYNNIGKFIENDYEKLIKLQRYIRCDDMSKEIFEQLSVLKYVDQNACVLELGGNKGRVSLVIATILNDDTKMVVIEPTKDIADINQHNRETNCFKYNIETKVIGKNKVYLKKHDWESMANKIFLTETDGCDVIENIRFDEIQKKYNITFDTLIIDCEGAFYQILIDEPNILDNIKIIIIENDFDTKEHYNYALNCFLDKGFKLIETLGCYPINALGLHQTYMHQVFKK